MKINNLVEVVMHDKRASDCSTRFGSICAIIMIIVILATTRSVDTTYYAFGSVVIIMGLLTQFSRTSYPCCIKRWKQFDKKYWHKSNHVIVPSVSTNSIKEQH